MTHSCLSVTAIARSTVLAMGLIVLTLGGFGTTVADSIPRIEITIKDGRFIPEQLSAPAGRKFRLVIRNEGPGAEEFESVELNREKIIPAGQSAQILLGPLRPGTYPFFGEFHPRTAKGRIVVE